MRNIYITKYIDYFRGDGFLNKEMKKLFKDKRFRKEFERSLEHQKEGWGLGTLLVLLIAVWLMSRYDLLPDIPLAVLVIIVIIVYFLFRRR
ncbi:hypothetical protein J4413_03755 [Candidatus Woesearchaeota archaeon]|nr:hypothetical protein [Candidatus Woesearchaeota archaeon]